ncbi:unnamed protein product [Mytilus edulis]|uniref:TIR domain-containing protein n=1 Tax=Mytilus edulis TaxID=6550 RepID=A0A8S3RI63_MYTED|nr:unnamed protein product [Mytilus edulis]
MFDTHDRYNRKFTHDRYNREFSNERHTDIEKYSKSGSIILAGDLNSRTGTKQPDFIEGDNRNGVNQIFNNFDPNISVPVRLIFRMTDLEGNFHTTMLEAVNAIHFIEPMYLPKGKQYHIYMSYASSDSDFARQLENLLLEKGFKCCMCDRDFTPGKLMTEAIRDCMKQSVQVVVLLSKNYINSFYLQLEFFVVLELFFERNGNKPIILKIDKCDTPNHMKMFTILQADGPLETWIGILLEALNDQTAYIYNYQNSPMGLYKHSGDDVKSKYQDDLTNVVQRDEKRGHFRRHFFLSNTDKRNYSKEIPSIRKYIYDISTQEDNWGVEVPLKWIPLENEIIKHREMGKNILSFQTIKEISDGSHCLIVDKDEFKMFLKFHHDLGTVIYFDDVPDFIIINPNWFVKALRCIVSAQEFISENLQLNWKEYEESGYIGMEMIQAIFQQKDPELAHNQEHIMHVLDKYDIVVEMPNVVRQRVNEKLYCVPCIVKSSAIESITNNFVGQEKTSILCFEFEFLPPVFFCHLVVNLLRRYNLSNESLSSSRKALYRGACVFDIDITGCEKLFLCKYQNTIQVQIWRWNAAITNSGQRIRIDIEDDLTCIQRKYKLDSLKNYKLKAKCQFTERKISKLTDENMNFLRIQKISTELMCDILYELLLHDNFLGLKPRNESDISDLYSKIRRTHLRVPSNGWGGQVWPNESIQTNTGDDVERIRLTRNRLQHSSQFQMTDSEYNERIQQLTRLTERFEFC